ncbi:MAG TPA: hypothetical protein VHH15_14165 [Actinophytocola sp.]|nr:hypothetical protein [Actinophytocola sp.]
MDPDQNPPPAEPEPVAQPAEPVEPSEPTPEPTPTPEPEPEPAPEALLDETDEPDTEWQDQQSRDESLRRLGVDLDVLRSVRRGAARSRYAAERPLTPWSISDKAASGERAMVADSISNYFGAEPTKRARSARPVGLVETTLATHVWTAEYGALLDTLRQYRVAFLNGHEGTGRLATALAALAELSGSDKVVSIDLDDEADLTTVLDQDGLLATGHGHVVELSPARPPRKQTLATAGGVLDENQGYLVVVGAPVDALEPYAVPFRPPPAAQVLERHLTHLLRVQGWSEARCAEFVRTCRLDPTVAEQLRASSRPGEVVTLAQRLAETGQQGGDPAEAVALLPGALRDLAARMLAGANQDGDVHTLRRLTTRIAYAVYNGHPHPLVFELAAALRAALPEETLAEQPGLVSSVFAGGLEDLVDAEMRGRSGPDRPDDEQPAARRARLVDPTLAKAVLDVVWHDYDHLRNPLLDWLGDLGGDQRERVRMRAGQVAGQLAVFDFGLVYRRLLRVWAASERRSHRQAAAWAMERAVLEPAMTRRVCRQVRDWALSPDPFRNDTAARCYATRLGSEFTEDALTPLWLIAFRREQEGSPAVARALAHVYRPDDPEFAHVVLDELSRWARDGERCVRVHAARALTFLAHRPAPAPDDCWPALLCLARADRVARDRLVELWRATLTEPRTATRGWEALLAWFVRADGRGELDQATERFAGELLHHHAVYVRARFHLELWRHRYPELSILRRLHDNLSKGMST